MDTALTALSILGWLVAAGCGLYLASMALRESLTWGLACLFIPFVQLIFVHRFWPSTRKPFLGALAGIVVAVGPTIALGSRAGPNAPFDVTRVDVPDFPESRGEPEEVVPGVLRYTIALGRDADGFYDVPGHGGKLFLYLPAGKVAAGSLPCVLVTSAGTDGLVGTRIGGGDEPEQYPYAAAGMACVAYECDGPVLVAEDKLTWNDMRRCYLAYRKAMGGLVNARNALEFVLARVPEVDPTAIYTAGHSSAGSVALNVAAAEPRIAGVIAYAPPVDYVTRARSDDPWWKDAREMLPNVATFARRVSPIVNAKKLGGRPMFLFHARDDTVCELADSERLADELRAAGASVDFEVVGSGEHYDSMIQEGIPRAIAWLQARHPSTPGTVSGEVPSASSGRDPERAAESGRATPDEGTRETPASEDELLRRVAAGSAGEREGAVQAWVDRGLDRPEGARLKMLRALGAPHVDRRVERLLVRSLEGSPISSREALDCVAFASPLVRKALVARLMRPDPPVRSEEVAAALARLEDDADLSLEEALVRMGHAREGAARRLALARGAEWTSTPEGKALLESLPLPRARELLDAQEPELRALGARLVARHPGDAALEALAGALGDRERSVRQEVAGCLERLGDPRGGPHLARALVVEQDEGTKARLRRALSALPDGDTAAALTRLVAGRGPSERLAGVLGVELVPSVPGVGALITALRDADRGVALAAAKALSALRSSRAAGVGPAVDQRADEIGRAAGETRDAELRRTLRKLYFDIRGRLPEQDRQGR